MVVSPLSRNVPAAVNNAKESSLRVKGAQLFNCLPRSIRDITVGTPDQFKHQLDAWLNTVPDQPTVAGRPRAAVSNSLLDQVAILKQGLLFS